MNSSKRLFALGGSLLLGFAGAVSAETTPSPVDLQAKVDALQARVSELEGKQNQSWLNQQRAEEVKTLVREVLADADTRASLLAGGATAGHNGKNFFLASEDGNYLLVVDGLIQVRYVANFRDNNVDEDIDDETETGFSVPRARVQFSGHVGSSKWTYALRLAGDEGDNSVSIERAIIGYQLTDTIKLWAGEDDAPFLREELTNDGKQLAVDRSLVNEFFNVGYTQGLGLEWQAADMVKLSVMLNDGARAGESNRGRPTVLVFDPFSETETEVTVEKYFDSDGTDIAVTARVDVKVMGNWASMQDFQSWSGEETSLFVGGAIHYEVGETGDGNDNDNFFAWTGDASFKTGGFGLYGAIVGLHTDNQFDTDVDLYGAVIQASYFVIPDKLEPFVRYEWLDLSDVFEPGDAGDDNLNILTVGANYYFLKHAAKAQLDVVWAIDGIDEDNVFTVNLPGLGLAHDAVGEDNQFAIRAQVSLMF